jgi:Zn-dependent M28 family amino/carboxypeptidase
MNLANQEIKKKLWMFASSICIRLHMNPSRILINPSRTQTNPNWTLINPLKNEAERTRWSSAFGRWSLLLIPVVLLSCGSLVDDKELNDAAKEITKEQMMDHITVLSSDAYQGRGTGTEGEQMSVDYLVAELEAMGAQPGVGDSSFVQKFPLLGQVTDNHKMRVNDAANGIDLAFYDDFVAWPSNQRTEVEVQNAELVYVGYGIQAPEYNWDDYKGVDVEGKIVVIKNNDPEYDENLFGGRARLYYGRYTYKYEKAQEMGAIGAVIIHTTPTAGYGWSVVSNSWSRERFYVKANPDAPENPTKFNAWITEERSSELFAAAGLQLSDLLKEADNPDFEPVVLEGLSMSVNLESRYREILAQNVVATIPGNDPELKDEYLVLTAHFDHLGVTSPIDGDAINNGAEDNAAGVSAVLEMMESFKAIQPEMRRSVAAVLVSAEEVGLLGSEYWAQHPTIAPSKVTANINLDGMNVYGPTNDLVIIGLGRNTMADLVVQEAGKAGRPVYPDPAPENGIFYRSDHFNMAKVGIPAIFPNPGREFLGKPEGYLEVIDSLSAANYHSVNDEVNEYWDLSGAEQDTRIFFKAAMNAINAEQLQRWTPGDEFEAVRLKSLSDN